LPPSDQTIWPGLCTALCGLCSVLPNLAHAAPDPLVERGKQFARIACSQCHIVGPEQDLSPALDVSAPAFEAIANRHDTSERSLQLFISKTHWDGQTMPMTMPAPGLTKQETLAVARYIMSLRKP